MAAMQLTRTHRILIGVVVAGALVIAGIGFAGSYSAVRALALQKGFGSFSLVFPIGIDAGICVLLALDLLLTWMRIPFPLLRQTAWLLTAATIAFNGAAAWPDPLGVGMHAVIPILFVVTVEAARHAVGRIADITADRHMEGVRITRWLLSPIPTFKLWRRMKLWELRSYEQAVTMEQDRLIYQARLQARYGRSWRRKAPVEALMPLRLARIGVPLSQTAPEGLAAAGIDPVLLPPATAAQAGQVGQVGQVGQASPSAQVGQGGPSAPALPAAAAQEAAAVPEAAAAPVRPEPEAAAGPTIPLQKQAPDQPQPQAQPAVQPAATHAPPAFAVDPTAMPAAHNSAWFAGPVAPDPTKYKGDYNAQYVEAPEPAIQPARATQPTPPAPAEQSPAPAPRDEVVEELDQEKFEAAAYEAFHAHVEASGRHPSAPQVDQALTELYGPIHPDSVSIIEAMMPMLKQRYQRALENDFLPS
ncbi:DUF2637 domain-containing protein [Streptomyces sp. NPDC059985]|uniref:DUF2637 domain-containing protein n=1 Tax=Streptomyces sp. NPDC059985 TaxID=3347025 RepID=UPI0036C9E957